MEIWNIDPAEVHNPHNRRFCHIRISEQAFADMFTTGKNTTVVSGLPDGAVFAGVAYDLQAMEFVLRFYHPSFQPVPKDEFVPHLDIFMEQV
jgi:hypothetical protein